MLFHNLGARIGAGRKSKRVRLQFFIWVRILCNDAVTTIFQWVGSAPRYDE